MRLPWYKNEDKCKCLMVFLGHLCLVRYRNGVRLWMRSLLSQGSGIDGAIRMARHTRKHRAVRGN